MNIRTSYTTWQEAVRNIATALNSANKVGSLTLAADVTSTIISDSRVGYSSVIILMPETANAADESPYISTVTNGAFTVTHANSATTDRIFNYIVAE